MNICFDYLFIILVRKMRTARFVKVDILTLKSYMNTMPYYRMILTKYYPNVPKDLLQKFPLKNEIPSVNKNHEWNQLLHQMWNNEHIDQNKFPPKTVIFLTCLNNLYSYYLYCLKTWIFLKLEIYQLNYKILHSKSL